MHLADLPTELYSNILSHIPPHSLQKTVLSLTRALPFASIPIHQLFQSIRLTHAQQAVLLYRRLRVKSPGIDGESVQSEAGPWVREFSLETWDADAEIINHIVRLLSRLESLSLWIGPSNFAPEHLENLLLRPLPGLKYLSLRFRPYVQKATYYQFMKGAYFDSTLIALSRWPTASLPTISIVQDRRDPDVAQKQAFAQPIVFFRLHSLTTLLHSPSISSSLTTLRLRIPSRPVVSSICGAHLFNDQLTNPPTLIAALDYLDLSTCGVLESELDMILIRFKQLKYLIMDECSVLRGESQEGEWASLGKRCALVGVRRAKERESVFKIWLESATIVTPVEDGAPASMTNVAVPTVRRGRRGLATATISLRQVSPVRQAAPGPSRGTISFQDAVRRNKPIKTRILPPVPTLLSLCATTPSLIQPDRYATIRAEFETGFAEGIAQLTVTRARLRASARNKVRVMRFRSTPLDGEVQDEEGLEGLEAIDIDDTESFAMPTDENGILIVTPPVLCLVGPGKEEDHPKGCGHMVGWQLWKDDDIH